MKTKSMSSVFYTFKRLLSFKGISVALITFHVSFQSFSPILKLVSEFGEKLSFVSMISD